MTEPQDGSGKRRPVTEEQWAAGRELIEGEPATSVRVARAIGMDLAWFHKRTVREGWRKVDYRHQDVLALHREAVALSASYVGVGKLSLDDIGGPHAAPGEGDAGDEAAGGTAGAVTLERAQSFLSRQMDRLMVRAERGGRLDKIQIDGLVSMSKMIERWMEMIQTSAVEQQKKSDDELAETLNRINAKIVELAQEEAVRMVRAGTGTEGGKPRRRRVAA